MEKPQSASLDILGIKPISDAINTITIAAVTSAQELFNRICHPAAEEFGLYLKDRVHLYRISNLTKIANKSELMLDARFVSDVKIGAHPRIVHQIIENGSRADSDEVQNMWAGLLTSSCSEDGNDDSNLIFINLLSQLTSLEAKILNHICENSKKKITKRGLIFPQQLIIPVQELQKISGVNDIHRLDRELDHLRSMELVVMGFDMQGKDDNVDVTPTALAVNLYVRCQGAVISPVEYFGLTEDGQAVVSNNSGSDASIA